MSENRMRLPDGRWVRAKYEKCPSWWAVKWEAIKEDIPALIRELWKLYRKRPEPTGEDNGHQ